MDRLDRTLQKPFAFLGAALLIVTPVEPGAAQTSIAPAEQAALAAPGVPSVQGDLSHLVLTARTGLFAKPIAPDDGGVVNNRATSFEVGTGAGAGVEVAVNGEVVPLKKLGRRAELEDGSLRYTYYGVVLAPGRNTVVFTPLGAANLRGPSVTEHVWGPGPAAALRAGGCPAPRADGRTACVIHIAALDEWGHPAAPGSTLKAVIAEGDATILRTGITGAEIVTDSPTPAVAGGQRSIALVLSTGSTATIQVVPGNLPGRVRVAAGLGAISTSTQFDTMANARPPFVTGLATVGVGAVPGDIGADPTAANGTNSRRGRVALYGTGRLSGNAVGSLAYDTAGSLAATSANGSFTDNPNDRPYATYGDASTRRNDALTQDKLYARIDDGYSSAMWGEFGATTGPQGAAGAVAMQVDGAKLVVGSATTSVTAFTAANHVGYGREVFPTTGLSTLSPLLHDNLIIGSETLTLVSLDRRTGLILKQTPLENLVDYTVDYTGGLVRFVNVPLPFDAAFNPQEVLVTYEYSAVGGAAKTTGGRFELPLGRQGGTRLGMGYLNDVTGTDNFALLTENVGGVLPGGDWAISHASSSGSIPGASAASADGGSAFRFAGSSGRGPYKFSFGYGTTSVGYGNPFGDLQTPGLTDSHATLVRTLRGQSGDIALSYEHERSATLGSSGVDSRSDIAAMLHQKFGARMTLRAGLAMHASATSTAAAAAVPLDAPGVTPSAAPATPSGPTSASVTQATLGMDWKALQHLALSIERDQTVGGANAVQPAQTMARLTWELGGHGRIFAQELLSDTPASGFGTIPGSASHAFELGIEEAVDKNTSVSSTYDIAGTGNATEVNAAIGVKERLELSRLLKGDVFVQRGFGSGITSSGFAAYGLTLGFTNSPASFKATSSLQTRTGTGGGATWSLGAAGKLFGDFSLLASDTGSRALGSATADSHVALAWRPSKSDRGALFAGYERAVGNAGVAGSQSGVASLDGVYRPLRRLEVTGRYARKIDGDSTYVVGTALVGLGLREQIGERFDAGVETRAILAQSAMAGLHSTAFEVGAMVGDTMRAALGYNFGATADPTLAAAPTRKGIYGTLTTTIDRIFGWGAH